MSRAISHPAKPSIIACARLRYVKIGFYLETELVQNVMNSVPRLRIEEAHVAGTRGDVAAASEQGIGTGHLHRNRAKQFEKESQQLQRRLNTAQRELRNQLKVQMRLVETVARARGKIQKYNTVIGEVNNRLGEPGESHGGSTRDIVMRAGSEHGATNETEAAPDGAVGSFRRARIESFTKRRVQRRVDAHAETFTHDLVDILHKRRQIKKTRDDNQKGKNARKRTQAEQMFKAKLHAIQSRNEEAEDKRRATERKRLGVK